MSTRSEKLDECIKIFNENKDKTLQDAKYLPTDKRFESLEESMIKLTEMVMGNSKLIDMIIDRLQYLYDKEEGK